MHNATRRLEDREWVGGHPVLDFVNSVNSWTGSQAGQEYLRSYEDVLEWHRLAGLIGPNGSRALGLRVRGKQAALRSTIDFRAALRALFQAVAAGATLPQAPLDHLNELVQKTARWRRLVASGTRISCGWDFTAAPPAAVLGPLAWQAAELLEHGPLDRIKECRPGDGCGWLFLDLSKNRSRNWCSMKTCGNSAKVKRFRARRARASAGTR